MKKNEVDRTKTVRRFNEKSFNLRGTFKNPVFQFNGLTFL